MSTDSSVVAGFVPLPDMLLPTLVGLIGLAFYVERTRRKLAIVMVEEFAVPTGIGWDR